MILLAKLINNLNLMIEDLELLKDVLTKNKYKWIKSNRTNNTGVGKTFEDLINKKEDNLSLPDLKNIEIKTQRETSDSYVTLFTKAPAPRGANKKIRENFGTLNEFQNKTVHTTLKGNVFNNYNNKYQFKIKVNREEEKIYIIVKENNTILSEDFYWTFSTIKKCLKKIKNTAYISAKTKKDNELEYFQYSSMKLLLNISFDNFINSLENGMVVVDIRIGTYNSGAKKGLIHDHGTAFRIKRANFQEIFQEILEI